MPEERTPREERYDFRGGMSRQRRQMTQQVYLSQNMRSRSDGTLEVRNGYIPYATLATSGAVTRLLMRYTKFNGLYSYCIQQVDGINDKIYANTTELTGVSPFGSSRYSSIVVYKDVVFFSNGLGQMQYHVVGTSARTIITGTPTPPVGAPVVIYKDKCYVGKEDGDVAYSNTGMFSALPECNFPADNKVTLGSEGDGIVGLIPGQDFLTAFRVNAFNIMTGTPSDDGELGDMSWMEFPGIGCGAPNSIASEGKTTFFLGANRRPYLLNGTILEDIDKDDLVAEYLAAPSIGVMDAVTAIFYKNELWIALPKGVSRTDIRILIYHKDTKVWTVFTNIDINSLAICAAVGSLYGGVASGTSILELDTGSADGAGKIPVDFISRQEVVGVLGKRKLYKFVSLQSDMWAGEAMIVSYAIDSTEVFATAEVGSSISVSGANWGAANWGAANWGGKQFKNQITRFATRPDAQGYELRIRVTGSVSGKTRLLNYSVEATVEERDREVI